ncbi:hypothetical protein VMCG_02576 [Cytospora schulzeri]|uniref:Uncharacterized protein n=1 Tax=Cytospora schulzeri TaxID=448051 RepID=A0A423X177_9PEZI|nr:hypothetical protein VMCG_02576 [Valsa malicola]
MSSFSPYNLSAQFARSAVGRFNRVWTGRVFKPASPRHRRAESHTSRSPQRQPGDSDVTEPHIQAYEHLTIKHEDDDDSESATHGAHQNANMTMKSEDDLNEESSDEFRTPDGYDGRDEPIRSIEDYDESQFGIDSSPILRGGSRIQDIADVAEEDQNDDDDNDDGDEDGNDDNEDDLEPRIDMDDYYESEDDFENEYDVDSEDLAGYRVERTKVKGIATWPQEVARAHKTLALRGAYYLMPSTWNWDLIDHPFVEGLFAPADSDKKLLFQEKTNRSRVTRALRNLFELHIRICAYRQDGLHDKIADLIEKEIRAYSLSVEKDVKLRGYYDYVSPIFIIKFSDLKKVQVGERETLGQWVHQQAMQACQTRVEQYHAEWAEREVDSYPRFLYTFVIIQQTVLIWMNDTDLKKAQEPYVLASLDMSKRTAWLETSLAIAITIQLAKDSICAHRSGLPLLEEQDDDPDA